MRCNEVWRGSSTTTNKESRPSPSRADVPQLHQLADLARVTTRMTLSSLSALRLFRLSYLTPVVFLDFFADFFPSLAKAVLPRICVPRNFSPINSCFDKLLLR